MAIPGDSWQKAIETVQQRFERAYRNELPPLPPEAQALALYEPWHRGTVVSPFWKIAKFAKKQRCLDLGCGPSFLVYPCWREWDLIFYGRDVSPSLCQMMNARGSQLNSKLYKGTEFGAAHHLPYEPMFDRVIATGVSCYFPLAYWEAVIEAVRRVLKPDGALVFDAIDPASPAAEDWAILETYVGAEGFLTPLAEFRTLIQDRGGKIQAERPGNPFVLYRVIFPTTKAG
ncbi:MAG: class I SAM-dependent methyltransferase [Pseudanabaenaceae cyanobacterium]